MPGRRGIIHSKKRPGSTTSRSDTTSGLAEGQQSYQGAVGDARYYRAGAVVLKMMCPYANSSQACPRDIFAIDLRILGSRRCCPDPNGGIKDMEWLRGTMLDFENIDIFIESYADGTFSQR